MGRKYRTRFIISAGSNLSQSANLELCSDLSLGEL
jgi:hypothetical protein